MSAPKEEILEVARREVPLSDPDKIFFPRTGHTKLDLVRYYMAVADGALRGVGGRPMALKRFVNGAEGEAFFQKRAPTSRPEWIETVELSFPSGRTAEEIVVRDAAQLAWIINLGCIDLNPHPVRAGDLDHPDELRVDLDPVPGVSWAQIRDVGDARRSQGLRAGRLAKDVGVARHAHLLPHRAALDLSRGPPRGGGAGARGRASRSRDRDQPMVERRTAWRLSRVQPKRQGPDGRLCVLRPPPGRCPRVHAIELG